MLAENILTKPSASGIQQVIHLSDGSRLLDTTNITALCKDESFIQTWNTTGWNLLSIDRDEKIAFFEADDSWLLAKLDLITGEWITDDDPLFMLYSLNEDDDGIYVMDECTEYRYYLK